MMEIGIGGMIMGCHLSGWKTTPVDRSLKRKYTVTTLMMNFIVIILGP